jgi:hypothetical protein
LLTLLSAAQSILSIRPVKVALPAVGTCESCDYF